MLRINQILDKYALIRPIGLGAYGEVWLCMVEKTGEFKALRYLVARDGATLEREETALTWYRTAAETLSGRGLLPIEHIGRSEGDLFFTMPLADGADERSPSDLHWKPKTLTRHMHALRVAQRWFSADEVKRILLPLLESVRRLDDVGMPHHEIDPDHVIFIGGVPTLADFSFLGDEAPLTSQLSSRHSYAATEYLESGGHQAMWGVATLFHTLLTGDSPDKMDSTAAMRPPPQREPQSARDKKEWQRFRKILLRITSEPPGKRYERFQEIIDAIGGVESRDSRESREYRDRREPQGQRDRPRSLFWKLAALWIVAGVIVAVYLIGSRVVPSGPTRDPEAQRLAEAEVAKEQLIIERDEADRKRIAAEEEIKRLHEQLQAALAARPPAGEPPTRETIASSPVPQDEIANAQAGLERMLQKLVGMPASKPQTQTPSEQQPPQSDTTASPTAPGTEPPAVAPEPKKEISVGEALKQSLEQSRRVTAEQVKQLETNRQKIIATKGAEAAEAERLRNEQRRQRIEASDPFREHRPHVQGAQLQPSGGL